MSNPKDDYDGTGLQSDGRCDNDLPGQSGSDSLPHINQFFANLNGKEDVPTAYDPVKPFDPMHTEPAGKGQVQSETEVVQEESSGQDNSNADGSVEEHSASTTSADNSTDGGGTKGSKTRIVVVVSVFVVLAITIGAALYFGLPKLIDTISSKDPQPTVPVITEPVCDTYPAVTTTEKPTEPTTAEPTTEEPTIENVLIPMENAEPVFLVPTDEDFEALGIDYNADSFLNSLPLTFLRQDEHHFKADFHSESMDTAELKKRIIFISISDLYKYCFGELDRRTYSEEDKPFENGGRSWIRYPEENILWIAENVLNMKQSFSQNDFMASPDVCRYLDGNYYFYSDGFDTELIKSKMIDMKELDDNKYEITVSYLGVGYDIWEGHGCDGVGKLTVALKEIDGKRVWSVYDYQADVTFNWGNWQEMPEPADVYAYYQQQIDDVIAFNMDGRNQETAEFNLYDMDGDGIPELFLNPGYKTNAYGDFPVYSYTADRGGWYVGSVNRAALAFYDKQPGNGEINVICVHHSRMGELSYKIADGELVETTISDWHERTDDEYDDDVDAIRYMLVMKDEWIPLEDAESYFDDLLH